MYTLWISFIKGITENKANENRFLKKAVSVFSLNKPEAQVSFSDQNLSVVLLKSVSYTGKPKCA